uniref:Uncharacterized protein n=1 Tax=Arion vulgaris TaxID=1028688 RepID=A0A0B6Z827_9EUPU
MNKITEVNEPKLNKTLLYLQVVVLVLSLHQSGQGNRDKKKEGKSGPTNTVQIMDVLSHKAHPCSVNFDTK